MSAVDRAREALAHLEGNFRGDGFAAHALRDLLAEIDAHWVDAREIERLLIGHGLEVSPTISTKGRWKVYDVAEDDLIGFYATAAQAIRAAREAAA